MRWDELDLEAGLWILPRERVKTDQPHEVPLSAASVNLLKSVPRIAGSSFVFTTNGTAPSSGYSKGKRKLDALLPSDIPTGGSTICAGPSRAVWRDWASTFL